MSPEPSLKYYSVNDQALGSFDGYYDLCAKLPTPDEAAALTALGGTYMTWYGINFSYPVFLKEISRHDPHYYRINWGGQGQLPKPLDVMPEHRMIEAGD